MELDQILALSMFLSFILLLFTGFPVAWILGGLAVVFSAISIFISANYDVNVFIIESWAETSLVVERIWDIMNNWVLVALPMFVFMGLMLDRSGMAEQLMSNLVKLFGRVRGGYAITVALIGLLLAASTGIIGASVTLLTLLALPPMLEQRYSKELACGTICAVGTLGILIPPSIMLVLMADRLSLPAGDLFLGALLPGILLGVLFILYILVISYLKPELAPLPENAEPVTLKVVVLALIAVLPPALLILAVLGSIFMGIATPTEASGVGAFGAALLALFKGRLNFRMLKDVSIETTKTTAFIFAIFVGATAYSLVLRGLGGDELVASGLKSLPFGPDGVVIAILCVVFILGFFLDWVEITLIVLPLVAPVVVELGFDLVWFTVVFAVCLQTSFLTPPVGFALFYLKGVAPPEIRIGHVYRGVVPFIILQLVGLMITYLWKDLVLWLPSVAYG
ncbi:TRAP transporter large permease [Beggiatoa leptomitoformis]|uniref:TRAP transporter large permease protein n=1 Tax=Beggiatoa leptomitoformis TaxID=288004 RepID=A0A2N9YCB6_9GAMM|nr:TRAP transporter large permease subunit [Beggiatoa leptomitoformis]ALG66578.1 TRAP transporter large permease subunit [Beggiatoa leptomitoformis]AUI68118.1 TRAP transporter large permease subunit [Beggiatoa leptomitoformis]